MAPHIETLHDYGCDYILGVKEGDHAYLFTPHSIGFSGWEVQAHTDSLRT
jgi:hypothetical protein